MKLACPRCGSTLRYFSILGSSCERCVSCGWLSLGMSRAEVVRLCQEAELERSLSVEVPE